MYTYIEEDVEEMMYSDELERLEAIIFRLRVTAWLAFFVGMFVGGTIATVVFVVMFPMVQ